MLSSKNEKYKLDESYKEFFLLVFIFICFVFIGLHCYKDYGFPWDEVYQLDVSHTNREFINHRLTSLESFEFRSYGCAFELLLLAFARGKAITEEIYIRHIGVYIYFILNLFAIYYIARKVLQKVSWSLLVVFLVFFSPRFFASSFYDSKDISFLASYSIGVLTLFLLMDRIQKKMNMQSIVLYLVYHSFSTAFCIATRVPGGILFIISLLTIISLFQRLSLGNLVIIIGIYSLLTIGLTIALWPSLWQNPVGNLITALAEMSHYKNPSPVLYFGEFYRPDELPWHYLLVSIGITTPYAILIGLTTILIYSWKLITLVRMQGLSIKTISLLVIISWLLFPLMFFFILKSPLYDSWRHMYFIYPPIVILAVFGLRKLFEYTLSTHRIVKISLWAMSILILIEPLWFIIQWHPYEFVYFNRLAGNPEKIRSNFDMDYWGLSSKQAVDYILETDQRERILITSETPSSGYYIEYMLPDDKKSRIKFTDDPHIANYYLTDYRWHPQDYSFGSPYYEITVNGTTIFSAFKMD